MSESLRQEIQDFETSVSVKKRASAGSLVSVELQNKKAHTKIKKAIQVMDAALQPLPPKEAAFSRYINRQFMPVKGMPSVFLKKCVHFLFHGCNEDIPRKVWLCGMNADMAVTKGVGNEIILNGTVPVAGNICPSHNGGFPRPKSGLPRNPIKVISSTTFFSSTDLSEEVMQALPQGIANGFDWDDLRKLDGSLTLSDPSTVISPSECEAAVSVVLSAPGNYIIDNLKKHLSAVVKDLKDRVKTSVLRALEIPLKRGEGLSKYAIAVQVVSRTETYFADSAVGDFSLDGNGLVDWRRSSDRIFSSKVLQHDEKIARNSWPESNKSTEILAATLGGNDVGRGGSIVDIANADAIVVATIIITNLRIWCVERVADMIGVEGLQHGLDDAELRSVLYRKTTSGGWNNMPNQIIPVLRSISLRYNLRCARAILAQEAGVEEMSKIMSWHAEACEEWKSNEGQKPAGSNCHRVVRWKDNESEQLLCLDPSYAEKYFCPALSPIPDIIVGLIPPEVADMNEARLTSEEDRDNGHGASNEFFVSPVPETEDLKFHFLDFIRAHRKSLCIKVTLRNDKNEDVEKIYEPLKL